MKLFLIPSFIFLMMGWSENNRDTQSDRERNIQTEQREKDCDGKRLFSLIREAVEERRETAKRNRKKVTESKRVVSLFTMRTRLEQSCSARLACAGVSPQQAWREPSKTDPGAWLPAPDK